MLCSCYGDGEMEVPGSVLRSEWVRVRLNYALAVERSRFVVVSAPHGEEAFISCYADASRRKALCRVRLCHGVLHGDDSRRLCVYSRDVSRSPDPISTLSSRCSMERKAP